MQTGDKILIAGFIITGNDARRVLIRAIGPSLRAENQPLPGKLEDPTLELFDQNGGSITFNDNWKDSPDRPEIEGSGAPPSDDRESAIARVLSPGAYTAVMRGKGDTTGIGLVEVYDRSNTGPAKLANISTRGFVETRDNVLITGFIVGSSQNRVRTLLRALGPSLAGTVPSELKDPVLELYNQNGEIIQSNNDWKESQKDEIERTGLAPKNDREAALISSLATGQYTGIVRGKDDGTGNGLVEVYDIPPEASSPD